MGSSKLGRRRGPPRFAFYTHDTYGMGHVRRCLNLIEALAARRPDAAILLITGSPAVDLRAPRPGNVDVVRLPTIAPTGEAENRPPHLPIGTGEIIRLRRKMIQAVVDTFDPDVLVVDNFALGARRELEPTLRMIEPRHTCAVLGLRDIVDSPEVVRKRWTKDGITPALRDLYQRILIFGEHAVMDAASAYELDAPTAAKIEYCGYVARPRAEGVDDAWRPYGIRGSRVLATVGGGGDGLPLLKAFLGAMPRLPDLSALVLSGPLQGSADREEVERLAAGVADRVTILPFVSDPTPLMETADLVVSMAGYNTVAELVSRGARALLVPRNWRYGQHAMGVAAGVEMEQPIRARLLSEAGLASMLEPERLTEETLAEAIREALAKPRPERVDGFRFDGATTCADILCAMIDEAETADAC